MLLIELEYAALPGQIDGAVPNAEPVELLESMTAPPDDGVKLLERMVMEKSVPGQDNYTGILIACQ